VIPRTEKDTKKRMRVVKEHPFVSTRILGSCCGVWEPVGGGKEESRRKSKTRSRIFDLKNVKEYQQEGHAGLTRRKETGPRHRPEDRAKT